MEDDQIASIWDEAVADYSRENPGALSMAPGLDESRDLAKLRTLIDDRNNQFKQYAKRRQQFHNVLDAILNVVKRVADTVGKALSSNPPVQIITAVVLLVVDLAKGDPKKYDRILQIFQRLQGFTGRLAVHAEYTISIHLKQVIVDIFKHVLKILAVTQKLMNRRRRDQAKDLFRSALGSSEDETKQLEATLDKLIREENEIVAALTLSQVTQARDEEFLRSLKDCLKPPDASYNHERARESRQDKTGQWFLDGKDFSTWKTTPGSCLWVRGHAGSGKSVLCSSAIEATKSHFSENPSCVVLYYYFDFNDSEKQNCYGLLLSLVHQLSRSFAQVPSSLLNRKEKLQRGINRPNRTFLIELVREICASISRVYVILDALDECNRTELGSVFDFLTAIRGCPSDLCNVLVTSRPDPDVEDLLTAYSQPHLPTVDLATDAIASDVRLYIQSRIQHDRPPLSRHGPKVSELVEDRLMQDEDGMFRWVALQLDSLSACLTSVAVERALKQLPLTLQETYSRMLDSMNEEHKGYLAIMLPYLIYAERPLTLRELANAIEQGTEEQSQSSGARLSDPNDLLRICRGLVSVFHSDWDGQRYVQLEHFSVQEYLTSTAAEPHAQRLNLGAMQAHETITLTCLRCLSRLGDIDLDRDGVQSAHPLAMYAEKYWPQHYRLAEPVSEQSPMTILLTRFFDPASHLLETWIYLYDLDSLYPGRTERPKIDSHMALYYASLSGVYHVCSSLLQQQVDVNNIEKGRKHGFVLQAACVKGHIEIAQLLLDSGAKVNASGGKYGSALQAACAKGHIKIVRLLLERGAEVNASGGKYGSILNAACNKGHVEIAQLLLDRDADVNTSGGYYGSALQAVCVHGDIEIAQLLLDHGAELNASGGRYGSALQAACANSYIEIARLLLERGADVNASGGLYGSALQAACAMGHIEIVRLLLDRGADVNTSSGKYGSAVQAACAMGHIEIVRLLLDRGADVNASGGLYGSVLHAACNKGLIEIARLLLDCGAELNASGSRYGSALQTACANSHIEITRLLLDRGAKLNASSGEYGSALKAACTNGRIEIAQLLLDRGAELNVSGGRYGSALKAACANGHIETARLLLDRGAELNEPGSLYGSALQAACANGHIEIARLLLDRGAKLNASGGLYGSALQAACITGRIGIMQLLLDRGADVRAVSEAVDSRKFQIGILLAWSRDSRGYGEVQADRLACEDLVRVHSILEDAPDSSSNAVTID